VALTVVAFPAASNIQFDRSVRSFFAEDHPQLVTYYAAQAVFGSETFCLAVYRDPELLTGQGMWRLAQFARQLGAVVGVESATCLADLPRPGDWTASRSLRDWFADDHVDQQRLRVEVLACEPYRDVYVGRDGAAAAVVLQVSHTTMATGRFDQTLVELRRLAADHVLPTYVVGTPVLINDVFASMEQDSRLLTYVSSAAMALVVLVLFRSLRWMIVALLVVSATVIWTRAIMDFAEIRLSIIGSMTTALITVIGIATVIHLAVRFREEQARFGDPYHAIAETFRRIGIAVFWTCATTAAGFGSLLSSRAAPVREYGLMLAGASILVGLAVYLTTAFVVVFGSKRGAVRPLPGETQLAEGLDDVVHFVGRHSPTTTAVALVILIVTAFGFGRLETESDFTRNFRTDSVIVQGYQFVEEALGGAAAVELVFPTPARLTAGFLDQVRTCAAQLREIVGVSKVLGPTDLVDFARQAMPAPVRLLGTVVGDDQQLRLLRRLQPRAVNAVWNDEKQRMRLVIRVHERQTVHGKIALIDEIAATAKRALGADAQVTGIYVLLAHLVENILGDQWLTFAISSLLILVMMTAAFRSPRLGLVALAPNLVPIVLVIGFMGWVGLKINVATAMIGSITMGLVVDFSVHYLTRFRQERAAGADFYTALSRTHRSTGKAMVFANIALMLGFSILVLSQFLPTIHFGILVSLAICGGLLGNLVMLPVLLRVAYWVQRPDARW
jgi:predicted RND superfamily exporter protein